MQFDFYCKANCGPLLPQDLSGAFLCIASHQGEITAFHFNANSSTADDARAANTMHCCSRTSYHIHTA